MAHLPSACGLAQLWGMWGPGLWPSSHLTPILAPPFPLSGPSPHRTSQAPSIQGAPLQACLCAGVCLQCAVWHEVSVDLCAAFVYGWSQGPQPFAFSATNGLDVQGNVNSRTTLCKFPLNTHALSKLPPHGVPRTNRGHVDGSRGLVHDEDAGLPHEGPRQAEQLPLALAEILPTFRDDGI